MCKVFDVEILKGHVSKDHVHLFLSIPPHLSVSKNELPHKGQNLKLSAGNRLLAKQFWEPHLWTRGYFAASSGNVTDDVIMQYIAIQDLQGRGHDGDFTIRV